MVVLRMMKDNKEVKPLLLKLGIALALSFAGFLYSQIRSRKMRYLPSQPPCSGGNKIDLHTKFTLERGLRILKTMPTADNAAFVPPQNYEEACDEKVSIGTPVIVLSPSNEDSEDEDRFIYPEVDEIFKDLDFSSTNTEVERQTPLKGATERETNQEIINLRNTVQKLREREMKLEIELLEYYGLKEQEAAVMELENRLKINNVEAQLFTLKVESLQADKQRMEAQMADYMKVEADLDAAKGKIKSLKRKFKSHAELNKEQISVLQEKVKVLQDQEHKNAKNNKDIESKLQKLKEMEEELVELQRANSMLQCENSELSSRLQSTQILASSVLEVPKVDTLQEANNHLRLENDNLTKEIEQLQADRCADVEELVYLRWVNACLRYELRNQQVPPGKTVARDLNITLSPRSGEKAKQLILEYSNLERLGDKGVSLMDIDSDYWSSSRYSPFTDTTEYYDSSAEYTSSSRTNSSTKLKLYSKLKRLVRKGDNNHGNTESPRKAESLSVSSMEDMPGETPSRCNSNVSKTTLKEFEVKIDEKMNKNRNPSQSSSRQSLDLKRLRSLSLDDTTFAAENDKRKSDVGYLTSLREGDKDIGLSPNRDHPEKLKLMKFAAALKESYGTPKSPRKLSSFPAY